MGQFSWITQDTNNAIRECFGCGVESLTTAYMHDNSGNVWEERKYQGYGVFGGKDFYELLAEMNGVTSDKQGEAYTNEMRSKGIDLAFEENSSGENPKILYPNLTRFKKWAWINEPPKHDLNQGWEGLRV